MADEQGPQAWVGKAVVVFLGQYSIHARLESVEEYGLILRQETGISWGDRNVYGDPENSETRFVPHFYPWHTIRNFRLLEEEEKKEYGLE